MIKPISNIKATFIGAIALVLYLAPSGYLYYEVSDVATTQDSLYKNVAVHNYQLGIMDELQISNNLFMFNTDSTLYKQSRGMARQIREKQLNSQPSKPAE